MSLFSDDYGVTARLYEVTDVDATKKATFNFAGAYKTIEGVVVIRITSVEAIILGDEAIDAVSQIKTTETLEEGAIIYIPSTTGGWLIKNKPRYNRIMDTYKVHLKEVEVTVS